MPNKAQNILGLSHFSVIVWFITLAIVGVAVSPLLNVALYPTKSQASVTVSFQMRGANAVVIDNEVTGKLEGMLSRVEGLEEISSRTSQGSGRITLYMDDKMDMDAVRFEVAMIVRQAYPSLPESVSYPSISVNRPDDEDNVETLMTYTIIGEGSNTDVGDYTEQYVLPRLSEIDGVNDVYLYGVNTRRIDLEYDNQQLANYGISIRDIVSQVRSYYTNNNLGRVSELAYDGAMVSIPVVQQGLDVKNFDPSEIVIELHERLFKLSDLVTVHHREQEPNRYYRVNGLNAINMVVRSAAGANQIVVAKEIRQTVERLSEGFPQGYSMQVAYDSSIEIKDEIYKITLRILSSLLILLASVWIFSRNAAYMGVVFISIVVNILIAFLFYWLFDIEIHIYSLAGITISLGMFIDNTIVMADHVRNGNGVSVFRAILAATLTTMGSLVVVIFLDEDIKLRLIDFVWVIMINLGVSLLVSLLLVPALLDKFKVRNRKAKGNQFTKQKRKLRWSQVYEKAIRKSYRFRWRILTFMLFLFGFPLFMIPRASSGQEWYQKLYNNTLASNFYIETLKPTVDKVTGGVLRLFVQEVKHQALSTSTRRTSIRMSAVMNDGSTMLQTNEVFKKMENYLAQYDEIEQFESRVNSQSSASINILFKPEHEMDGTPEMLKNELESVVNDIGSADWTINGVGRAFDNGFNDAYRNSRIQLYGYNLEMLKSYADKVHLMLEEVQRVEDGSIFINGRATRASKVHYEYALDLDDDRISRTGLSKGRLLNALSDMTTEDTRLLTIEKEQQRTYVYLVPTGKEVPDFWDVNNKPLNVGEDRVSRLSGIGTFSKEREQDLINKVNMEYTVVIEFNFVGSYGQKKYMIGNIEKRIQQMLPIGYRIKQQSFSGGYWQDDKESNEKVWLLLLVAVIIFFISAVVLESLRQPLSVLLMIPLSFIGVFFTFYAFDLGFDQGGYASLLLLSGLIVNSGLYILNDMNHFRKRFPNWEPIKVYIKALNHKFIPILLTLISTVLGLVPFLSAGKTEAFWFSLAIGTIGGLLFSLVILLLILPLTMRLKDKKKNN